MTKYQIVIPIYNQFNERVADGVDIVNEAPEKSIDVILRESSNPNTPTHNPALAQNATSISNEQENTQSSQGNDRTV